MRVECEWEREQGSLISIKLTFNSTGFYDNNDEEPGCLSWSDFLKNLRGFMQVCIQSHSPTKSHSKMRFYIHIALLHQRPTTDPHLRDLCAGILPKREGGPG